MDRTVAPCMISSALGRRHHAAPAPVWPRAMDTEPVRHPQRQRRPYRPRGHVSAESLSIWGVQEPASPRTRAVMPQPSRYRHKRLLAGGVAAALVGTLAVSFQLTTQETSDGVSVITATLPEGTAPTVQASPPQIAADTGLLADAPILPTATATPAIAKRQPAAVPPTPVVQTTAPRFDGQVEAGTPPIVSSPARQSVPTSAIPVMPTPDAAGDAFICSACASPLMRLDGFTISLHGGGTAQEKIATDIAEMGASAVVAKPRAIDVATSQIRFYRPQDLALAQSLARRFDATLVDVTWLSDAAPARIDLLLRADTTTN